MRPHGPGFDTCPDSDRLRAFKIGRMPEEELEALAVHLRDCDHCVTVLDALADDSLVAALGRSVDQEPEGRASATATTQPRQLGDYLLGDRLGRGGMGIVYRALHTRLNQVVAVKVLSPDQTSNPRLIARFEQEMKLIGSLIHPNLVLARDAREVDGVYLLTMELLEGSDLDKLLRLRSRLPLADACEVVRQAAVGLQHAHEKGIVHRDIKPSNLMLTPEGCVKVLDLGLARLAREEPPPHPAAGPIILGTVNYMAPEQAANPHTADIRADIYSLGCTLYHLLAGHPPFAGPTYADVDKVLEGHAKDSVPSIGQERPDLTVELAAVLDRMLAKLPEDRYATPAEVAAALLPFTRGHDLPALLSDSTTAPTPLKRQEPPGVIHRLVQRDRRHLVLSSLGGGAAVALVAIVAALGALFAEDDPGTLAQSPVLESHLEPVPALIMAEEHAPPFEPQKGQWIHTLAMSRDGKRLVVGESHTAKSSAVRVWDVASRKEIASFSVAGTPYWIPPAVSKDGQMLASASGPKSAKLWHLDSKEEDRERTLIGHTEGVLCLAFSPDGSKLVTGSSDNTAIVWEASSGKQLAVLKGETVIDFMSLCFSADGRWLASGHGPGDVRVWDMQNYQLLVHLKPYSGRVDAVAFSPNSEMLAASDKDANRIVKLWILDDLRSGKTTMPKRSLPHSNPVGRMAFTPNNRFLATIDGNTTVTLWDVGTGKEVALNVELKAPANLAFAPDGKTLVVGTSEGARFWYLANLPDKAAPSWWHLANLPPKAE